MEDPEEYKALTATLSAFYHYSSWEHETLIKPRNIKWATLSDYEKELIPWYPKHRDDIDMCIGMNEQFTKTLASVISADWGVPSEPSQWSDATYSDFDKVRSTMLQLTREWTTDGESEREKSYIRIVNEVCKMFPDEENRQQVKVLVPGCGLGRQVVEFVKEGFWTQGNEFSFHMLLASNFVLNHCKYANSYSVFPFLHKSSHLVKRVNQIRPVTLPDMNPLLIHQLQEQNPRIPYEDLMSMTAGSFVDLYGPPGLLVSDTYTNDPVASDFRQQNAGSFDVVSTCFFIDTASNFIDYLRTIHYCLKPGGVWINFGPLLWHFEEDGNMHHIRKQLNPNKPPQEIPNIMKGLELSREDLISLIEKVGFKIEKQESNIDSTYTTDVRSLGQFIYKCEYWVARKLDT